MAAAQPRLEEQVAEDGQEVEAWHGLNEEMEEMGEDPLDLTVSRAAKEKAFKVLATGKMLHGAATVRVSVPFPQIVKEPIQCAATWVVTVVAAAWRLVCEPIRRRVVNSGWLNAGSPSAMEGRRGTVPLASVKDLCRGLVRLAMHGVAQTLLSGTWVWMLFVSLVFLPCEGEK